MRLFAQAVSLVAMWFAETRATLHVCSVDHATIASSPYEVLDRLVGTSRVSMVVPIGAQLVSNCVLAIPSLPPATVRRRPRDLITVVSPMMVALPIVSRR